MKKIVVQVDADLEDLIPRYLQNRRQDLDTILPALGNQDFETVKVLGHNMKGTGGGYGFDAITKMGRALEEAAKSRNPRPSPQGLQLFGVISRPWRLFFNRTRFLSGGFTTEQRDICLTKF